MKKYILTSLSIGALTVALQSSYANNTNQQNSAVQTVAINAPLQNQQTWLGVSLAPVPKALSKQLGNLIPENQGVMVQSISPNSPASKTGLQAYDILLSFNDQQLYSAQQLAGLVASSKADDEINLKLVRNGKATEAKIKLEARTVTNQPIARHPFFGFKQQPFARPLSPMQPQGIAPINPRANTTGTNVMQQFESISINKTGDGKVRAEVSYEINGDKKEFTFEGKYDEVRQQISETKELPEDKKSALLNALDNKPSQLFSNGFSNFPQFPAFPRMPAFDGFFSDPFYNQPNRLPSWYKNNSKL